MHLGPVATIPGRHPRRAGSLDQEPSCVHGADRSLECVISRWPRGIEIGSLAEGHTRGAARATTSWSGRSISSDSARRDSGRCWPSC